MTVRARVAAEKARKESSPECTQTAHRYSLAIFHRRLGHRREFQLWESERIAIRERFLTARTSPMGAKTKRDLAGSGTNRRRNRRELHDLVQSDPPFYLRIRCNRAG